MEGYIAEIRLFAGNFAPRSWAFCQGQILSIAQNTALFSLLGTTFGGNGQTTFALPDLRGRVPVGPGQGPGLPTVQLGEQAGSNTVTLIASQIPAHNHPVLANSGFANTANPNGNALAIGVTPNNNETINMYTNAAPNATLNAATSGIAGGSQPHNNMQPYLGLNYIICMEGIYPSRN